MLSVTKATSTDKQNLRKAANQHTVTPRFSSRLMTIKALLLSKSLISTVVKLFWRRRWASTTSRRGLCHRMRSFGSTFARVTRKPPNFASRLPTFKMKCSSGTPRFSHSSRRSRMTLVFCNRSEFSSSSWEHHLASSHEKLNLCKGISSGRAHSTIRQTRSPTISIMSKRRSWRRPSTTMSIRSPAPTKSRRSLGLESQSSLSSYSCCSLWSKCSSAIVSWAWQSLQQPSTYSTTRLPLRERRSVALFF